MPKVPEVVSIDPFMEPVPNPTMVNWDDRVHDPLYKSVVLVLEADHVVEALLLPSRRLNASSRQEVVTALLAPQPTSERFQIAMFRFPDSHDFGNLEEKRIFIFSPIAHELTL